MKLQVSDHVDAQEWDETVSRLGGTIFHSSTWAKYSSAVKANFSELYITSFNDEGVVVGATLAFVENSKYRTVNFFTKRMLLFAAPVVKDGDAILYEFILKLEEYCRKNGFVGLSIHSHASPDISKQLLRCGYNLTCRYEFILDLDQPEEQLWKGLDESFRRNIKKAEKNGVIIRELPVEESIVALNQLQEESAKRILARKGPDLRQFQTSTTKPTTIFIEAGLGRFFSAVIDGEIVSTSFFTLFNGMACHNLFGANDRSYKLEASKLLMWHAIKSYRTDGARTLSLGGCNAGAAKPDSSEHGVYLFKKRLGAHVVECASGEKILGVKRTKFINHVKSAIRRQR